MVDNQLPFVYADDDDDDDNMLDLELSLVPLGSHHNNAAPVNSTQVAAHHQEINQVVEPAGDGLEQGIIIPNPNMEVDGVPAGPAANLVAGLNIDIANIQWEVTKVLKTSDIGSASRLLIPRGPAEHLMSKLTEEEMQLVRSEDKEHGGLPLKVVDLDTMTVHQLKCRVWEKVHVLNLDWTKGFVRRRNLKPGDKIGVEMVENHQDGKKLLLFKVLQSPQPQLQEAHNM